MYIVSRNRSAEVWIISLLAYGWRARGKFKLTNQDSAGGKKTYCPHVNVSWQERHWNQAIFLIGDGMKYSRKGICNSQNHVTLQKVKNTKHFMSPTSSLAPKMVVPLASPGRIIVVLFWTKYAVRRQIVQFWIHHDRWIKALTTHLYMVSLDLK